MNEAVVYLIKMVACSGALYAYYLLALRNRIFHQWNRFYLLAAVLFSLLFPAIPMPELFAASAPQQPINLYALLSSNETEVIVNGQGGNNWSSAQWMMALYCTVAALFLGRLFYGLAQVVRLLRSSPAQQLGPVSFVATHHPAAPFSFFKWLFWKKDIELQSPGGQSIFRHELVHIREHHSVDKILLQAVLALCWINPFFWIICRELHLIHEFIADKKAVGNAGTETLAAMILQSAYGNQYSQLINPFFQQPIKRRLAMLQKTLKQPRNAYLGRILSLPLCVVVLFAFSKNNGGINESAPLALAQPITVIIDAGHGGHDAGAAHNGIEEKNITLQLAQLVEQENRNKNIRVVLTRNNDQYAELKQRTELVQKENADLFISLHVMNLPENTPGVNNPADRKGIEVYLASKNETLRNRSILLGSALIQQLGKVYETKPNLFARQGPGIWVLDQNTVPAVLIECGYLSNNDDRAFITNKSNQRRLAQQIIAAIEAYANAPKMPVQEVVDTIPAKPVAADIKEIHVNKKDKEKSITIIYKNGKKEMLNEQQAKERGLLNPPPPPPLVKSNMPHPPIDDRVLVVIDGKEKGTLATTGKLDDLYKPENIESINVLKNKSATEKYGDKGKYGAIEINLKKPNVSNQE